MAVEEVVVFRPSTEQVTPAFPRLRKALPSVVVIVAYLSLGVVAFWPGLPRISTHVFSGEGDFAEAMWFIGWVPHALIHGLNPFWSDFLNVPMGVNLGSNTEAPLLGVLAAPFSLVFNPLVATNLLLMLGMPISATAAFIVFRKWQVWRPAAAIGGLVYGFSPYMVGQSTGHPQLMFQPWPPLIALTAASILQGRGNPWRLGISLGLLVTAQYLVSPEVLAMVVIFGILAGACVVVRHPRNAAKLARVAARPVGTALAVSGVLLAYPVWMLIAGPQHVTGPTFPLTNPFHDDLLSFVVPGPLQVTSMGMHSHIARILNYNNATEAGGYIGIPLLIVGGILAWRSRRNPCTQLALVLLFVAAVLSLGPHLVVDARLTHIPLPFLLLGHLPLVDNILPVRFSFLVAAFLAAVIAFGLNDIRRAASRGVAASPAQPEKARRRKSIVFAAAVLITLVVTQLPRWPYATARALKLPASIDRAIPAGSPVTMTYPYSTAYVPEPMSWQVLDGYKFRLLGGYVYIRDSKGEGTLFPRRMNPPGLQQFLTAQEGATLLGPKLPLTPELVATTKTTISRYHIRLVILDRSTRGSGPVLKLFNEALGRPKVSSGRFTLWVGWRE